MDMLKRVQKMIMKMMKGLELFCCEKWLKELLPLFSLEKRSFGEDLIKT